MQSIVLGLAAVCLIAQPTAALAEEDGTQLKGEIVQVQKQVRTQGGGEYDQLTIRTRQGEQMRLRLHLPADCDGCVQNGDRVRVRLMSGGAEEGAHMVREMKVRRTGASYQFQGEANGVNGSGQRLGTQTRSGGDGAKGSGERVRTQTRTGSASGSGTCTRTRSGGTGGQRGGGRR
jgi:hypothetical protein